jgi:uncharacterized repeat protein (TIGR03803 family)
MPAFILFTTAMAIMAVATLGNIASATTHEKLLHRFMPRGIDGAYPEAPLIADRSGNYYGTANLGGTYNVGTVFELSPREDGSWAGKTLYSFRAVGGDGNFPFGNLVLDSHGYLYGTTYSGGAYGAGTVFVVQPQSNGKWSESVLYSFNPGNGSDGSSPQCGLIFDAHGNLYGTTVAGGAYGAGTVFELSPQQGGDWNEAVLYGFNPNNGDAGYPYAGLSFDPHGNLYGVTSSGGASYQGAVFELSPGTGGNWSEQVLYSFCSENNCIDGSSPFYGGVILDEAGNLYGTTESGGTYQGGVVFKLSSGAGGWTETVLHSFGHSTDGRNSGYGTLLIGKNGNLYGTTAWGGSSSRGTLFELSPTHGGGWAFNILYDFKLGDLDGWYPFAGLIFNQAGNLVGTTAGGGSNANGTVFQLTSGRNGWTESLLYNFNWGGEDGANPEYATLVFDKDGNLYGTTYPGGAYDSGVAFELKPDGSAGWTEQILYSFGYGTNAGDSPTGLIFDATGNLYAASASGGAFGDWGTVYELSPREHGEWKQEVLHSFNFNGIDGYYPFGSVVFDASGNLYGTTLVGGEQGLGIVYQLKPNRRGGWTETILHSFVADGVDGIEPYSGLTIDSAGNLYGTTVAGGSVGAGTVFDVSPDGQGGWTERVVYAFGSQNNDGYSPIGDDLIFDSAHNLYGTTQYGGVYGGGTVFQLTPQQNGGWTEQVLYSFCAQTNCTDGAYPVSTLVFDAQGNLYGTTTSGGSYSSGAMFKLMPSGGGNWVETVLHNFNANGGDGSYPEGGLVFDSSGTHLFGTTYYGGSRYNAGVVFEITP